MHMDVQRKKVSQAGGACCTNRGRRAFLCWLWEERLVYIRIVNRKIGKKEVLSKCTKKCQYDLRSVDCGKLFTTCPQNYPQMKEAILRENRVIHQVIHIIHKKGVCINLVKTEQMFCPVQIKYRNEKKVLDKYEE